MRSFPLLTLRVIDGDTVEGAIDLGLGLTAWRHCRLRGINAPELHAIDPVIRDRAEKARARLTELTLGKVCWIECEGGTKDSDKYGRVLAILWATGQSRSCNDTLLAEGLAVPYMMDEQP